MKHFIIPDVQVSPDHNFNYLTNIGEYIVDKQPDVIVCLGDFADMQSLSYYDYGKKSFEGRRYRDDIASAQDAMYDLTMPMEKYNARQRKSGKKQYHPRMVMTLGNHENRINRAVENDAKLEGVLDINALGYVGFGWEVYDFLVPVIIDGVAYSHYFTTGVAGRPASSAAAQLRRTNMSSIAGHQQGLQIATTPRADGARLTSIIAGSCYHHDEEYLGPQGNKHWRGALMLHEVQNGQFDLMPLSLNYLEGRAK